jgi:hypothetical protein
MNQGNVGPSGVFSWMPKEARLSPNNYQGKKHKKKQTIIFLSSLCVS